MEYVIIGLLVLLVILATISLFKNINEGSITERLGKLETTMVKEIGDFKSDFSRTLFQDFEGLNNKIEDKVANMLATFNATNTDFRRRA